jgi:hypothetical protein
MKGPLEVEDRIDRLVVSCRPFGIALPDCARGLLVPLFRRLVDQPPNFLFQPLDGLAISDQPGACKRDPDDRELELDAARHL